MLFALAAHLPALARAHGVFAQIFIDGAAQGDGKCLRTSLTAGTITSPITDVGSRAMACGAAGGADAAAATDTCAVPAGAKLSFEFRLWADGSPPGTLDASHYGAMAIYARQVVAEDPAQGKGWFKLWEDGYDEEEGTWATQKLIANHGFVSLRVPHAMPDGTYLLRPEIVALHNLAAGPAQFYVGCAQVAVRGGGGGGAGKKKLEVPEDMLVAIPGYIAPGDPGVRFNSHPDAPKRFPYPLTGPPVYRVPGSAPDDGVAFSPPDADDAPVGSPPAHGGASNANLLASRDGRCGGDSGFTCQGSGFGNCCSPKGWCGSSLAYCSSGCQADFGTCRRRRWW
ncbi:glycosyl hydrolase family 61-domain-containing protein [Xylariomycetidae sp. FL0641]|nr:glycosyl hydrolase family 61-domain-containing protein [Xylariomycetidae sp. FL0641]